MNANSMFPSKYLKAADIGSNRPVVTISEVGTEIMKEEGVNTKKAILFFKGKEKSMVCNKTNWNTLIDLLGYETDEWIGKSIRLCTRIVEFQGKAQPALRVESELPNLAGQPQPTVKPEPVSRPDLENEDIQF